MIRKILFLILSVLIMIPALINFYENEEIKKHGEIVLFKIYNKNLKDGVIFYENIIPVYLINNNRGKAIIDTDENGVAIFKRIDNNKIKGNEKRIGFDIRKTNFDDFGEYRIFFGAKSFNPQKTKYENAEFVVLKIGKTGKSLFMGFADEYFDFM